MIGLVSARLKIGLGMEDARKLFGRNVAKLCDRDGFSRTGLAAALGVQPQMVSRWIAGKNLPTKYLDGIAKYLSVPVKELFAEPNDPSPKSRPPRDITPLEALKIISKALKSKQIT